MTYDEIQALKATYAQEREKPCKVSKWLEVHTGPIDKSSLPIKLKFISAGGWASHYDVEIVGGPDNGKRVEMSPWHPELYLGDIYGKFNGTKEEADEYISYVARPCIVSAPDGLHAITIAYLSGVLETMREYDMASFIVDRYDTRNIEE